MAGSAPGRAALVVDPNVCIGSQDCIANEPDLFALDGNGVAFVTDVEAVARLTPRRLQEIAQICPNAAISVRHEAEEAVDDV